MAKKSKKGKTISMPGLGNIETFKTPDEGEYRVRVTGVEQKEGDKADYLNWELEIVEGKFKDSKLWYITSFSKKSLWNLKLWLEALEAEIPDEPEEIAIDDLIGLECMVTATHEEYEGKTRAKVTDFAPVDGGEDVEVEDEEEGEEEEGSEKYTAEQIQEMDEDELADLVKKHDLDVKLKKLKSTKKKQNAVIAALEEEDLIEEED